MNDPDPLQLNINQRPHLLHLESRVTLLDALRQPAHLTVTMSGNICRCGAYPHIVKAVKAAA